MANYRRPVFFDQEYVGVHEQLVSNHFQLKNSFGVDRPAV
jgi:hypothetical protein